MKQFSSEEIAAVYKAIAERRDIRHFLPDPIAPELLARLLNAAHAAPSVGFMQPWRFIRISDPNLRASIYHLVEEAPHSSSATDTSQGKKLGPTPA